MVNLFYFIYSACVSRINSLKKKWVKQKYGTGACS